MTCQRKPLIFARSYSLPCLEPLLDLTLKSRATIQASSPTSVGGCIFTAIVAHLGDVAAASRIVANIVVGVGFLGAGIISRDKQDKSSFGLTTAATVWCTAAVGVTIGLNEFIIAIGTSLILYFLLALHHQSWYVN